MTADVTERQLALEASRAAEERFELALEIGKVTAWECDAQRRYSWIANTGFGLRPADVVGRRIGETIPNEAHMRALERVYEAGEPAQFQVEGSVRGQPYHLLCSARPVKDAAGRVARVVGASVDITELAARLRASRSDGDRFLGEMLALAVQVPGPDHVRVRVQDNQPVLFAWGHARGGPGAERATLTGRLRPASAAMAILPPPPSPFAAARPSNRWLLPGGIGASVLLAALALLVFWRDPMGWFAVGAPECRAASGQADLAATLRDEAAREGVERTAMVLVGPALAAEGFRESALYDPAYQRRFRS